MAKIIIVKQQDIQDCGVCCLSSIISFYGGYVPLERLRLDTHTTSDGATAYNLLNAASKYGFETKGIKVESLDDSNIYLPAIAHLKYRNGLNHFVVIYEITKTKVVLMDPAKGKVTLKRQEFLDVFSNILLMFYPKEKILCLEKGQSIFQVFGNLLLHEKKIFIQIVVVSIILTILTIISSYYFKVGLEAITNNPYLAYFKLIVIIFGIVTIFKCLFTYMRFYLENHLNKNIDVLLLSDFLAHLFKLPSNVIGSRSSAEILARVGELNNLKSLYTELFVDSLLDFILMFTSIPILLIISAKMFLVLFFIIVFYLIIGTLTMKKIYQKAYQNITYEEEFNNYVLESIKSYPSLKNLNLTNFILKTIEEKLSIFLYDNYEFNTYLNKTENLKNWVNEIGFFLVNTVGLYLIIKQSINIADLITFNSLMTFFLNPIKNLIDMLPKYNFFKATFTKISDFINIPVEKLGKRMPLENINLTIKNVSFSYNDLDPTLKDISFKAQAGEIIMFKGKSGCGKSTMCKILNKELTNYQGSIMLGKRNIKDYSLKTIRDNILYVGQNENLFSDTILNNIIMGRNISAAKFDEVTKLCGVEEIVNKKPFRYETFINNGTHSISGGEKQRIVLARSLLKDAKIIILDEVLSEVDYELEQQIINNLKQYFKNKIIIYITHKNHDSLFDKVISFAGEAC